MSLSDNKITMEYTSRVRYEEADVKEAVNNTLNQIYKELRLTGDKNDYCFLRIFKQNFGFALHAVRETEEKQ